MEPTRRRRPRAWNIICIGIGMMIGGSVDISGPGGGVLVIGVIVALCGFGGLLFRGQ